MLRLLTIRLGATSRAFKRFVSEYSPLNSAAKHGFFRYYRIKLWWYTYRATVGNLRSMRPVPPTMKVQSLRGSIPPILFIIFSTSAVRLNCFYTIGLSSAKKWLTADIEYRKSICLFLYSYQSIRAVTSKWCRKSHIFYVQLCNFETISVRHRHFEVHLLIVG